LPPPRRLSFSASATNVGHWMFSATSASDYALKHLKISPWRGRPMHPHAASKNKSLGRILLQFIEKEFEDCNIIFRQCARDLGRKHFVTERCWVEQSSVGNTSSKPMLERWRARREISAKATAVQRNASRI